MFDYQCIFCTKKVSKQTNKRTKFRTRLSVRQTFGLESRSRELCEYDGKYTMGSLLYHTNVPSVAVLSVFLPLSFTPSIASFPPSLSFSAVSFLSVKATMARFSHLLNYALLRTVTRLLIPYRNYERGLRKETILPRGPLREELCMESK